MSDNIHILQLFASLDIPAERVLQQAIERGLERVVIVGVDKDGGEYFASSVSDGGDITWMLERAKWVLMKIVDEGNAS